MEPICAISTAYGSGGIAVVRVSGDGAIGLVDKLFRGKRALREARGNSIHYGTIVHPVRGEELDEVLVSVFRAPHSFTGEDTAEIACHGSLYIQQELLRWLVESGCRAARAGEFTQRAFLNGHMDLSQAESVADLIAAQSKAEKDLALSQLRGGVSNELASLREQLLHLTSLIELELDFADHEELEFADRGELRELAARLEAHIRRLTETFKTGNAIRNGVPVAIIGATNAGKSTLLNALVGEERAIVSDVHGTTRDTVEDTIVINGVLFRLIDTAGLRETQDAVEAVGIVRSRRAAERALIIVHVIDGTRPAAAPEWLPADKTVLTVYNKSDLCEGDATGEPGALHISAKRGEIGELVDALRDAAQSLFDRTEGTCISNVRHYEALLRALEAIRRVQAGLESGLSGELLSEDLHDCLQALGEITGQITSQEVLNNIFAHFCVGK